MELRKDAERSKNSEAEMKAEGKTSETPGMEEPTTPQESGKKQTKERTNEPPQSWDTLL